MTDYITKDSGEREEFDSGMKRDTESGKPRFDLMIPDGVPYEDQLLTRFAKLLSRGAEKYDARNWEQANSAEEVARAKSSAFRHFMQWYCGERDEDHAAAVIFGLLVVETTEPKVEAIEIEASTRETLAALADDMVKNLAPVNPGLAKDWVEDWDKAFGRPLNVHWREPVLPLPTFQIPPVAEEPVRKSRFDDLLKSSVIGYFTQGRLRD